MVRNECVLTSASMIVYLFFTRSWSAIIGPKFSSRGYDRQSSEQNNRKLISLHNNGEDDCVKKIFPWKFNLEYGGTFTKLFMHVSSRNMFATTRNLQICVHVYRPRHYARDTRFELFREDYRSCEMFSWWTKIYIYIPYVPHKNNCKNKIGSHNMKQTDSSIIIVRNVSENI
jgi:hypothetical protein